MTLTTPDVIGLLVLSVAFLTLAYGVYRTDRVLQDPDHPDHEDAKAAVEDSVEDRDRWL